MRGILAWLLGLGSAINGLIMLAAPADWYDVLPGVVDTGPLNEHFVRDIGAAYLVAGAAFVWFAIERLARPAAQAAAAFLSLHALVHLWDAAAGRGHPHQLLVAIPTVFVSALLAIFIVWPPSRGEITSMKEYSR